MKRLLLTILILVPMSHWCGSSWADVNQDDVYVWRSSAKIVTSKSIRKVEPADNVANLDVIQQANHQRVIFLDDSITQMNPDTVVRAVIKR